MPLRKSLENRIGALVVGFALNACGEDPDTKYVVVGGESADIDSVCQEMYQHTLDCEGFALANNPEAKKQKILNGCLEYGHLYPQEFWECIFQQCGPKMIGACDGYIDDIK